MKAPLCLAAVVILLSACSPKAFNVDRPQQLERADSLLALSDENAERVGIRRLFDVDHSRLAEESGEILNASRVVLYSDAAVNTALLQSEPRVGLDLPFKLLAFSYAGSGREVELLTIGADFINARHGLNEPKALEAYEARQTKLLSGLEVQTLSTTGVDQDYGIVELESALDFEASITALKEAILAEGDTVWFGRIDYHTEALELGVELPNISLLVFGAPGPGAKAMYAFPTIGVDAFPQKVLVYESSDGAGVRVIYNDIAAMAQLHTGKAALPHRVIKSRLKKTLSGAIQP
ncbi:MAG: DUF302 domain-containing protein [Coraliomargarita sp.]